MPAECINVAYHTTDKTLKWYIFHSFIPFFRFFLEDCYRRTVIVDGEEVTIDVLDTACRVS